MLTLLLPCHDKTQITPPRFSISHLFRPLKCSYLNGILPYNPEIVPQGCAHPEQCFSMHITALHCHMLL